MAYASDWCETHEALRRFEELLQCSVCKQILVDPRSLYTCDHHFCRKCLSPSNVSRCPACNVPAWTKDLKSNQQIDNIVRLTATIRNCISASSPTDPCLELCPNDAPVTNIDSTVKEVVSTKPCNVVSSSWKSDELRDGSANNQVCGRYSDVESTCVLKQQHHGKGAQHKSHSPSTLAKVRKRNMKGETPLHLAAMKGDAAAVVSLVEQGADCRAKDNAGWTPLHEACNYGHVEIVKILLDHGISVNIQGFENNLPLHDAVINNHTQVAMLLMSFGANPNARNSNGSTPLDLASTEVMRNVLTLPAAQASPSLLCAPTLKASGKVVMLLTGLKGDEKIQLQELAKLLQGEVATSFSPHVSHVIAPCNSQRCCARTLKSLSGVAAGKWVLSFDWVKESLKGQYQQEESLYEIQGFVLQDVSKITKAPQLSRENTTVQKPGLFAGCSFYFHGSFMPPSLSKTDIASLVTYAGGSVLRKLPKPVSGKDSLPSRPFHAKPESMLKCPVFIVYDPASPDLQNEVPTVVGVTNISTTWILDCLSSFQLLELPV